MQNCTYSKKYAEIFIKISTKFLNCKDGERVELNLPVKCMVINPSIRFNFSGE